MIPIISEREWFTDTERQSRTLISFSHGIGQEQGTVLGRAFLQWRFFARVGVPDILRVRRTLPVEIQDSITSVVDVSPDDPIYFRFREHKKPRAFEHLAGKRICELSSKITARSLVDEYLFVKVNKTPSILRIRQSMLDDDGTLIERHYNKLSLPVCDANGKVEKIVVVWRPLSAEVIHLDRRQGDSLSA